ncbi:Rrf2 family transcriptional regulator [Paenibacillus paridis]|uniref:Rrf2 family transcriptional regulator n=1 Tax=Paenibacillus paridis TaxID=2583376 RepID=UPI001121FC7F|nr:Rrf2 family transcriptional regulator [Paenibacillus paridis]
MASNSHFTVALHILSRIYLDKDKNQPFVSSALIARSVNSHAVFIRRILGALNRAGLVSVRRGGVNGGWSLAKSADLVTLLDVYEAVEEKPLKELHYSAPNYACPIGRGIQPALTHYYESAEAAFRKELSKTTLTMLVQDTLSHAGP